MKRLSIPGGTDAALLLTARVVMSGQRALVSVVVPIYLARRGYSATRLAVLFAVVALAAAVLSVLVGQLSDRFGRRLFVIVLPLAAAAAALVFLLSDDAVLVFAFAALGSFGRGSGAGSATVGPYQPAEQALMAGLVDDEQRPRLFGLVASASALGGLLGAVLVASPIGAPTSRAVTTATYRPAFAAAVVLALVAAALAVFVRESRPEDDGVQPAGGPAVEPAVAPAVEAVRPGRRRLSAVGHSIVWRLFVTNTANGVAVGLFGPFVTYWFFRRFGAGTTTIGKVFIVVNLVTIATNLLAPRLARRLGAVPAVVVTRSAQALLLVPLALSPNLLTAGAVYTARMIVQRIGLAVRQSFVMTAAPRDERARIAALSQLPSQGLAGVAPLFTGYLFDEVSLAAPFEIAAGFQLVNALSFGYLFRRGALPPPRQDAATSATAGAP